MRYFGRLIFIGFTLLRFHTALMELGSPPLGLLGTALDRG